MIRTAMLAWQFTQEIGKLKAEGERLSTILELNNKLIAALYERQPAHIVDGIEYAIHSWTNKVVPGPYRYVGIRADFARYAGDSPDEDFDAIANRMNMF